MYGSEIEEAWKVFILGKREFLKTHTVPEAGATLTASSTLGSALSLPHNEWVIWVSDFTCPALALPKQEPWESKGHFALVTGHCFSHKILVSGKKKILKQCDSILYYTCIFINTSWAKYSGRKGTRILKGYLWLMDYGHLYFLFLFITWIHYVIKMNTNIKLYFVFISQKKLLQNIKQFWCDWKQFENCHFYVTCDDQEERDVW